MRAEMHDADDEVVAINAHAEAGIEKCLSGGLW